MVNFRRSLFYGIDRDMYNEVSNPINPELIEAFSYSGRGFVTAPNRTDYLDLGDSAQWQTSQFDLETAEKYKQLAIEELTAQGVSFPIELTLAVPTENETRAQQARLLQEAIQALGTDYVTVIFVEYTSSSYSQQRQDGTMNNVNSMSVGSSHWDYAKFDEMVEVADQMTDLQERYTAFANIEAWLNENAYYIPLYQSGGTYIVTSINEFTRPYAPTGIDEYKWKGIVGLDHAVTAEEHEQFREEYEAGRQAAYEEAQQYNS